MIIPKKNLNGIHRKTKEMKNVKRDENSLVETFDERLKRLRTNEIETRKRLKIREEEGGRAGKTKVTWKGKIDE